MSHRDQKENPQIALNEREQIQYLLGNPPSWMMRYGISVMLGLFTLLLVLSYLIHYPDTVSGKVVLTTQNPPIRLMAKTGGRVQEILVQDKQRVEKGQVLAVLENTAHWQDVMRLEQWLLDTSAHDSLPEPLELGELQNTFATLAQQWKDKQYFDAFNGVAEKIGYLERQIQGLEQIRSSQVNQIAIFEKDYVLAEKTFRRQQQLHKEKLSPDQELEAAEMDFLGHQRQLESARAALFQQELQIRQLQGQILDLKQGKSDNHNSKNLAVSSGLTQLKSAIDSWKQTFLVVAPIAGRASFSRIWSAQQSLNAGEEVMAIVPEHESSSAALLGKVQLGMADAGKVAGGQRAILKLDGYPEQEYGVVEARVAGMSLLPQQENKEPVYLLDLELPSGLLRSDKKEIPFRQEMSGEVRLITEDKRVLDRIFNQLSSLFHQV
ncbi:MAG TPA: HlyD family efflux transporter periplasmic adaptor subunit [Saprospiraceae bacterium]|nr:HlyD family efflux transporter periplasmic adaptor subunit [Saprospiraceae bacterium]